VIEAWVGQRSSDIIEELKELGTARGRHNEEVLGTEAVREFELSGTSGSAERVSCALLGT
jgi:hypothetical protein